jgi:hypothetical protein
MDAAYFEIEAIILVMAVYTNEMAGGTEGMNVCFFETAEKQRF